MLFKLLPVACLAIGLPLLCVAQHNKDSIAKSPLSVTWGLRSQGFVPFSGVILNHHPMLDILFTAPVKPVTFFFYKSLDAQDYTTGVNYITTGFLKTFPVSKKLSITTAAFYCISQMGSVWDSTSDAGLITKANWQIGKRFSAEVFIMACNLTRSSLQKNLTNRAQISCHSKKIDLDLFAWYFTPLWHNKAYIAISPQVTVNHVSFSKNIHFNTSLAWFGMLKKSSSCTIHNSVIFSVKYPIRL